MSAASAAVGYLVLVLAARSLDQQENAEFLTLWAVLFTAFGVMSGISTEATRAVGSASQGSVEARRPRLGLFALMLGLGAGLLVGLSGFWWGTAVFGSYAVIFVPLLAATVAGYSGHAVLTGALAGMRQWPSYATVIGFESLVRLLAVIVVVLAGANLVGLAVAVALGAIAWLLLLPRVIVRGAWNARPDIGAKALLRTTGFACTAAASSAVLVVGFPVLLRLTSTPAEYLDSAALILAISLTRAPIMIPLNAYQGVAITYFMANRERGLRAAAPVAGAILVVSIIGAGAAAALGPWLMRSMLGPTYRVDGLILGWLTFDAGVLALLTISGALCLSLNAHRAFSLGWVTAVVVSVALLFLPVPIEVRTALALLAGPLAGILFHTAVLRGSITGASRPRRSAAEETT